jgi:hypothetical protein
VETLGLSLEEIRCRKVNRNFEELILRRLEDRKKTRCSLEACGLICRGIIEALAFLKRNSCRSTLMMMKVILLGILLEDLEGWMILRILGLGLSRCLHLWIELILVHCLTFFVLGLFDFGFGLKDCIMGKKKRLIRDLNLLVLIK